MKHNILFSIIAIAIICILPSETYARKEKVFYDSKADLVGIIGDYELMKYDGKFYEIDVPSDNIDSGFGKKVLDEMFMYNGSSLSEEKLKNLAMRNVERTDIERAQVGLLGAENILKEDYLPILDNIYVFKFERSRRRWHIYKVNITKDIVDQVFNSWNDMSKYNQITVSTTLIASGKGKLTMPKPDTEQMFKKKTYRRIGEAVPAFTIRGQVIGRHPFEINIGRSSRLGKKDRVVIYRAKEKNGQMYSSRVSTTRVSSLTDSTATLYTFAGGQASYKKGDVAVRMRSTNSSLSIIANKMEHTYGLNLTFDKRLKLNKAGMSTYFMFMFGGGVYDNYNKRVYATNNGSLVNSPIIMDAGLGYGIGFQFWHCMEVVPYVMAQWEGLWFSNSKPSPFGPSEVPEGRENYDETIYPKSAFSNFARFPVGVKVHLNLMYPIQLVAGAEYIFCYKFKDPKEKELEKPNQPDEFFFEPTGYKRKGLNLFAGLRFNF